MAVLVPVAWTAADEGTSTLKIATFNVDATPPIGSPVAYAPARKIEDPLFARGIVLLGAGKPIVLCAVDWIGIGNSGHTVWREKLAQAAGTSADRVAVQTLHQHDGVRCDFRAEELMEEYGFGGKQFDSAFNRHIIEKVAEAIHNALPQAQQVTHLGVGRANVEKVASNRRVLGADGKVQLSRSSAAASNPAAREAPEGLIDPELKLISFWNGDTPLACLTYYATHPQSYYGKGDVTSEFVGLARARREQALKVPHIHFNGAGGNIAAGKYNDGSQEMRVTLTDRMESGMKRAWESTQKMTISDKEIDWSVETVHIPVAKHLNVDKLRETLSQMKTFESRRSFDALRLAWVERDDGNGVPVELSRLKIGKVSMIQMPGELFVEYQLAAQAMRPGEIVCMAAYGDYGPFYIGTAAAYSQGGYEVSAGSSNVSPEVEQVLLDGIRNLLK